MLFFVVIFVIGISGPLVLGQSNGLIMEMRNAVYNVGDNATFFCIMRVNTTQGLQHINQTQYIEWSFRPIASNKPHLILAPDQNVASVLKSSDSTKREDMGQAGYLSDVKYARDFWRDLTIRNVRSEDAGTYTCRHTQYNMAVSAELYVVGYGPNCYKNSNATVFYEGKNMTFTCELGFQGNQPPVLSWLKPKLHVDLQHLYEESDNTPNRVSKSITMRLESMIDGKLFQCTAEFMNITSKMACDTMLPPQSVQYAPFITHLQTYPKTDARNVTVTAGSNLTILCFAHSNPDCLYKWSQTTTLPTGKVSQTELPCKENHCHLTDVQCAQSGVYMCHVSNIVMGTVRTANKTLTLTVVSSSTQTCPLITTNKPVESIVASILSSHGISPYAVGAVVCASLAIVLIVVFVFIALKVRRREKRLLERLTRVHDETLDDQEVELLDDNMQPNNSDLVGMPIEYSRLKQQWEIARKDIGLGDLIAKGTFVEVWQGRMRKFPRGNDILKVAVKRVVAEATERERKFFLAELEVMKAIQPHPNILPLIGCYTAGDPWLMVVEHAVEGSLYQYLQQRRPGNGRVLITSGHADTVTMNNGGLNALKLLSLAIQIVTGLIHINRYKMIFYRLRSANILVCKGGVCKLAGFGFTHDICKRNIYESNSAPVRWMSPESLQDNVYNMKTDVWSFGVVLWEIINYGHLPYPDMGPQEVADRIQAGYRMPQPQHCSADIYNLMLMCWAENPGNRPSFVDILQTLTHLERAADTHVHIDRLPEGLKNADIVSSLETIA
ncbi:fibroblast growth factor receptor 1-like isoform X1 [Dreissena polymorpha]|uniref:fibroblast growth factor receptor 1-like isoform X1 n=1 Tax=Dreissena polymorpha TaxID=45954 RepID=UPI0022654116|nr:fibroblast growth factor receptor 1-like isoform X1 [Dreissena polymorpha]